MGWQLTVTRTDILVFALVVVFGGSAILFHERSTDFLHEDVFYADSARSLIQDGFYGINGRSETNQPPGLPALLAILFVIFGYSHAICLCVMAVFEMLGFLACYHFLSNNLPKLVAASICILLISSPVYFSMAAALVSPCFPFFFTTVMALLAFENYENASAPAVRVIWGLALTTAIAASLMFGSAAIALLGAIVAVIGATSFRDRRLGLTRLRRLLPILLVGFAVQGLWMHRQPAPLEWNLPGYPAPYLEQLKVKNGNYPELGMATLGDLPTRIVTNAFAQSDLLARLVLRHGVNPSKTFLLVVPVLLVAVGWAYSIWQARGERILEWYFAGSEFIYLLWPWKMEARFFLPVAPLACFYVWKSIKAMHIVAVSKPRIVGAVWFPWGSLLGISGWRWIYTHWREGLGRWPDELMAPIWCVSAICAAWMAYTGRPPSFLGSSSGIAKWFGRPLGTLQVTPLRLTQYAGCAIAAILFAIGVITLYDIKIDQRPIFSVHVGPHGNLVIPQIDPAQNTSFLNAVAPEVESGLWIRSHTPINSIVMARHVPTVYHYAERRVVWFAPISNPDVLMQGISRHKVDYVIVIKHTDPYYLPDDDYCFDRLLANHRDAFRIAFQDSNLRIFQVERNLPGRGGNSPSRTWGPFHHFLPAGRRAPAIDRVQSPITDNASLFGRCRLRRRTAFDFRGHGDRACAILAYGSHRKKVVVRGDTLQDRFAG